METSKIIGENIKKWREFKGLKQETLAHEIDITPAALSQIENGKNTDISLNRLNQIAKVLEIEVSQLFSNPQQMLNINNSPNSSYNGVYNSQLNHVDEELIKMLQSELDKKNEQISFLQSQLQSK